MKPSTRKRIAVLVGLALVALLAGGLWRVRYHLRFYWLFESIGTNAQGYPEYRHRQTGIVMVRLPGGTFWMGAQNKNPEGQNYDPDAEDDEGPVHEVTLSPLLIGKYEVTQGQWLAVMGKNPSWFQPGESRESDLPAGLLENEAWLELPETSVSWDDIQDFEKVTGLTLPTEAQWEYACRAGTSTPFSFGAAGDCDRPSCYPCPVADPFMWWCANSDSGGGRRIHRIGRKQPNAFGLHDMHGNVTEWCEDVWDESFYSASEAAGPDPDPTPGSEARMLRGGGADRFAGDCRSAVRFSIPTYSLGLTTGFRAAYWPLPEGM